MPGVSEGCVAACRGCAHRELTEEESLARKGAFLREKLAFWAEALEPVRAAGVLVDYRESVCLRASRGDGRWVLGMLSREREVLDLAGCPVHSPRTRAVVTALAATVPLAVPLAFVKISGTLATLVLKARELPRELATGSWLGALEPARLGLTGLLANLNPSAGERVFSSRAWSVLWGEAVARDGDGFEYGPDSFRQALPALARAALDEAERFLRPGEDDRVVDLCSGSGSSLARWNARALGVELSGEAVSRAAGNAPGARVLRGRASERLPQLREFAREGKLLVYANPPRLGLEREVVEWLNQRRPARIAYLSCSPGTLARDLAALEGYEVRRLVPFDFFPRTLHVETLALLEAPNA
jgi:tRNA/tmRNA/rRNA uracil-C5-methylase (TrmA/RlmC/RlmD family)